MIHSCAVPALPVRSMISTSSGTAHRNTTPLYSPWLPGQAHPAALGFHRGVPLLSAAVSAARACTAAGGPLLSVQLDHGDAKDHVLAALEAGVDSVM